MARTAERERGIREWPFARPSLGWSYRAVEPLEELAPSAGRSTPVRTAPPSDDLVSLWRKEDRPVPSAVSYYRWRVFYTRGKVPSRYIQRVDPKTGEFPSLPKEVAKARSEGRIRLVESTLEEQVFEAVSEGFVDVDAPSAFDAIRLARLRPVWEKGFEHFKVWEVWRPYPEFFVPGEVKAGFESCLPVASISFNDADARTLCTVASYNNIGEFPTRDMVGAFTGLGFWSHRNSLSRLEEEGYISCEPFKGRVRRAEVCSFVGEPVGLRRKVSSYQRGLLDAAKFQFKDVSIHKAADLSPSQASVVDFMLESDVPGLSISKELGFSRHVLEDFRRGEAEEFKSPFRRLG